MYIQIVTVDGPRRVNATLVGRFGIHRNSVRDVDGKQSYGDTWAVTLLATGFALYFGFPQKRDALAFAKSLRSPAWSSKRWRFGEYPSPSAKFTKDALADSSRAFREFNVPMSDVLRRTVHGAQGGSVKGIISATQKPFAQELRVDDQSEYINIGQDKDMVCVSAGQWDAFLSALIAAAKAKGWR